MATARPLIGCGSTARLLSALAALTGTAHGLPRTGIPVVIPGERIAAGLLD
jgi:hypothetical protein